MCKHIKTVFLCILELEINRKQNANPALMLIFVKSNFYYKFKAFADKNN